ncbi:50S ribosomal protein L33 [Candidatus Carsonella ruddii]|nr:50S ribosomal protein L33 [Candidatus Carsonella ruddii]AGS06629.1 putative 50S ribosomal protein L33 [Candidatus Carsonella ruddii DC]
MYILIKLKSTESNFFYVKKKNKKLSKKINLIKFDPLINKRVLFKEEKL